MNIDQPYKLKTSNFVKEVNFHILTLFFIINLFKGHGHDLFW